MSRGSRRRARAIEVLGGRAGERLARTTAERHLIRERREEVSRRAEALDRQLRESIAQTVTASARESHGHRLRTLELREEARREVGRWTESLGESDRQNREARRSWLVLRRLRRCLGEGTGLG